MNGWLLSAGLLTAAITALHLVGGHFEDVRPLLQATGIDEVPRRTMHVVWHFATVDLAAAAGTLVYLGLEQPAGTGLVARLVALHFAAYAAVFLAITLSQNWPNRLFRLPQWILLAPVAVLSWIGGSGM